jgi:hypothetical protein
MEYCWYNTVLLQCQRHSRATDACAWRVVAEMRKLIRQLVVPEGIFFIHSRLLNRTDPLLECFIVSVIHLPSSLHHSSMIDNHSHGSSGSSSIHCISSRRTSLASAKEVSKETKGSKTSHSRLVPQRAARSSPSLTCKGDMARSAGADAWESCV